MELEGRPVIHSIVHDITEFRQLEEQLRQAQKMESIGRLAGGVAHDFNNMLAVILGYTQLVLDRTPVDDPRHEDLEEVLHAAEHSAGITRQLLAFARQQPISPEVLDLNAAVDGLLKMLGRLIGEDVRLVWRPGAEALAGGPGPGPGRPDPRQPLRQRPRRRRRQRHDHHRNRPGALHRGRTAPTRPSGWSATSSCSP